MKIADFNASKARRALTVPLAALALAACAGQPEHVDLLLRGGLVYDGTGSPPRAADVGIADGQIRFVKKTSSRVVAARTIDAGGLAVAPGFIDAHSHAPEAVERIEGPFIDAQDLSQGVTTIMASPDGGLSPRVMRQLQAALTAKGTGVNYGCYVGHNGIREDAMPGQRRAATPEEIERMAALVREGMEMGCVGLSTGLMYDPGMFATEAEVQTLAAAVKPYGGTYDYACALRAVTSVDGMTADYYPFTHEFLGETATRIINEVRGINRVTYDITSKPPGTIEWE